MLNEFVDWETDINEREYRMQGFVELYKIGNDQQKMKVLKILETDYLLLSAYRRKETVEAIYFISLLISEEDDPIIKVQIKRLLDASQQSMENAKIKGGDAPSEITEICIKKISSLY